MVLGSNPPNFWHVNCNMYYECKDHFVKLWSYICMLHTYTVYGFIGCNKRTGVSKLHTYASVQTFRLVATATAPFLRMWFQLRSNVLRASLSATTLMCEWQAIQHICMNLDGEISTDTLWPILHAHSVHSNRGHNIVYNILNITYTLGVQWIPLFGVRIIGYLNEQIPNRLLTLNC